ncbi:MAG TPA: hypothetical protein DCE71_06775 [Parachlamydiales bacterium]|nr:hypothetical protein [Parachlamydiales bacterium]
MQGKKSPSNTQFEKNSTKERLAEDAPFFITPKIKQDSKGRSPLAGHGTESHIKHPTLREAENALRGRKGIG